MRIALLTNIVSPHQVPLAKALMARIGTDAYRYVYTEAPHDERSRMGWGDTAEAWCRRGSEADPALLEADAVYTEERALELIEQRVQRSQVTLYVSERWFKPPLGFLRVFVPSYFRMVRHFLWALRSPMMRLLPQGVHAARDFARLMGLFAGDIRCLFRAPAVAFESRPGGAVLPLRAAVRAGVLDAAAVAFARLHGFVRIPEAHWGTVNPTGLYAKMRLWGYFVAPGTPPAADRPRKAGPLRVLWVGRMLDLKRVDTLIEAVKGLSTVTLDLYGHGPEEERLRRLANGCGVIRFHDFVPVEKVRDLMRSHDVYVLPSNGGEGWGAVVSEALEEGMTVLGTVEAGASATMLPPDWLYRAGDVVALRGLLKRARIERGSIGPWAARQAAEALLKQVEALGGCDGMA